VPPPLQARRLALHHLAMPSHVTEHSGCGTCKIVKADGEAVEPPPPPPLAPRRSHPLGLGFSGWGLGFRVQGLECTV
jgi:hypothetical protein